MGRPPLWETPEALQADVDKYFQACEDKGDPVTMSGLALALDCDRKTLTNYADRDEFFPTIKKARARVEAFAESRLFGGSNVAGVIFNLKNNFGWNDKTEQEITGSGGGPIVIERGFVGTKTPSSDS